MLGAGVPLAGVGSSNTPTSKTDKSLRALFCGAANHLTQLYMSSLKLERGAMKRGYGRAVEDLIKFLQLQQQEYGRTISVDALVDHLKTKKREIMQREDHEFGLDLDEDDPNEQATGTLCPEEAAGGGGGGGAAVHSFLGTGEYYTKPAGAAPFGSARSLAVQFEGLSAGATTPAAASSAASAGSTTSTTITSSGSQLHTFGAFNAASSDPHHHRHHRHHQFSAAGSQAAADMAAMPFSVLSSPSGTANPFVAALDASAPASSAGGGPSGGGGGRKRQFFEFFFDAPPPNLTPSAHGGVNASGGGGGDGHFQFLASRQSASTSTSSAMPAGAIAASESDGAMDFSCYGHQAWKRYRRDEEQLYHLPSADSPRPASTNTS